MLAESEHVRPYIVKYLEGLGVDFGCGLKKIDPDAMGVDLQTQYNKGIETVADFTIGWASFIELTKDLLKFDYLFSSHLLEDYENPREVLLRWASIVRPNGFIILFLPIEHLYKAHTKDYNKNHKSAWTGALDFYEKVAYGFKLVEYSTRPIGEYSFYIVLQRLE